MTRRHPASLWSCNVFIRKIWWDICSRTRISTSSICRQLRQHNLPLTEVIVTSFDDLVSPSQPFNNIAASRSLSRDLLQCVEACLLLGGQAGVEVVQRRQHLVGRLQHGREPLLHRLQSSDRRNRHLVGTRRLQPLYRLLRPCPPPIEPPLLPPTLPHH